MFHQHHFNPHTAGLFKKTAFLLAFVFVSISMVHAQHTPLQELIAKKDASFWKAYNACDIAGMEIYLAEDLEFYHDKGGITNGREKLSESLRAGLCKTGKNYLRREVVPGNVTIYPLNDQNRTYGAIISGGHLFYVIEGDSERLDGQAKFTHLWLKKNGEWKMHRILSFDHRPATFTNSRQDIELSEEELKKFTGRYFTLSKDPITVELVQGNLELRGMGSTFVLYPKKENSFFTKERDLTFTFTNEGKRKLTIFESNKKVAEAIQN